MRLNGERGMGRPASGHCDEGATAGGIDTDASDTDEARYSAAPPLPFSEMEFVAELEIEASIFMRAPSE